LGEDVKNVKEIPKPVGISFCEGESRVVNVNDKIPIDFVKATLYDKLQFNDANVDVFLIVLLF